MTDDNACRLIIVRQGENCIQMNQSSDRCRDDCSQSKCRVQNHPQLHSQYLPQHHNYFLYYLI